ncbi:MAG: hypothetical protein MJ210_00860 [Alphaproteobacteria bacterium]|nr:hypothetical protein [Alphaproteobacteria bacterium]
MIIDLQDIDITDTLMFREYTKAKEIISQELSNNSLPSLWQLEGIKTSIANLNLLIQTLSKDTLHQKADSLIEIQNLKEKAVDLIKYMSDKNVSSYGQFNNLWNPLLWQSRETSQSQKINVNGTVVASFDLDYMLAENLQQLYAGEDPKAEYYDWVEHQRKIEIDINTDGTTKEEVVARNAFIGFLNERESELRRIITLYSASAFNSNSSTKILAQEKLKFLTFKMSELRRLRERTANLKSQEDQKTNFADTRAANPERQKRIALASDYMLRPSSFLTGELTPGKALSGRVFNRLQGKNISEIQQQLSEHKNQRRLWRNFISKLRGISNQNDEDEITNEDLRRDLLNRRGFSAEQYLLQKQSMTRSA